MNGRILTKLVQLHHWDDLNKLQDYVNLDLFFKVTRAVYLYEVDGGMFSSESPSLVDILKCESFSQYVSQVCSP